MSKNKAKENTEGAKPELKEADTIVATKEQAKETPTTKLTKGGTKTLKGFNRIDM